jgi:hypothetical protein
MIFSEYFEAGSIFNFKKNQATVQAPFKFISVISPAVAS